MSKLKSEYQCDRCHKKYESAEITAAVMISGLSSNMIITDWCPECKNEIYKYLVNWINKKEVYNKNEIIIKG